MPSCEHHLAERLKDHAEAHSARIPGAILLDVNPYGVNMTHIPFRVMLDSYCYSLCKEIPVYDEGKWERHRAIFGLPDPPTEWIRRNSGPAVFLLPRVGGWKNPSPEKYIKKYSAMLKRVTAAYPELMILVRPHPKTARDRPQYLKTLMSKLKGRKVKLDSSPPETLCGEIRCVFGDWGTSSTTFVSRGIPIFNVGPEPRTFMAKSIAITDLSCLRDLETADIPGTPRDYMVWLSQSVFTKEDFESGEFNRFLDEVAFPISTAEDPPAVSHLPSTGSV